MKKYIDILLNSMITHNPSSLPLAGSYKATENSKPSALSMMNSWKTFTGLNYLGQCFVDETEGQVFYIANVDESGKSALSYGRLKIVKKKISEIELYILRSDGDAGFVYLPEEINNLPKGWTSPIPEGGKATREELLTVGKLIFNSGSPLTFEASEDCILMEAGGVVYEDPEYLEKLQGNEATTVSDTPVTIPAGLWPGRPSDPEARIVVIDEEQGVVISMANVDGFVCPYNTANVNRTCFVPACMIEMHRRTVNKALQKGRKVFSEMPANGATVELLRFHSGKIQGMHRFVQLQGPGAFSPWRP